MNNGEGINEAAEILRLVIPKLTSMRWPVTPVNYALWYEYYTADNDVLKSQLDELSTNDHVWKPDISEELFRTHVLGEDTGRLDGISRDVRSLLTQVLSLVGDADSGVENFSNSLKDAEDALNSDAAESELPRLVTSLLKETESMMESSSLYKEQLLASTQEVEQLRFDLEKVKQEALRDPLTGLANRKVLEQELAKVISCAGEEKTACVLMADVDHFKRLNDRFGHLVGDKVLKYVAHTLTSAVKGRDCVTRFGGEEFCIILQDIKADSARSVAESIRKTIQDANLKRSETGESLGRVTVSLGVTEVVVGDTPETIVGRADKALYTSKNQGRNRVTVVEAPSEEPLPELV